MKYCKKCGVLYSTDVCPKCGIVMPDPDAAEQKPRDPREVRRNWIALLIGIPAFIGAILLIVYLFRTITSA
ncbi:MAG: hypothetical protein IJK01_03125 [Clostridia bacterium]|jgi:uncharacterized membrane protein YvbJ|nr:hypothetical protein [Clostridia bacterium]